MKIEELNILFEKLMRTEEANDWIQYAVKCPKLKEMSKQVSVLSNGAFLSNEAYGYLILGVDPQTKKIKGLRPPLFGKEQSSAEIIQLLEKIDANITVEAYDLIVEEKKVVIVRIVATKPMKLLFEELMEIQESNDWIQYILKRPSLDEMGKWVSALSNGALLSKEASGYLILGIDPKTKTIMGLRPPLFHKPQSNAEIIEWLTEQMEPRIALEAYDLIIEERKVVIISIMATDNKPVKFNQTAYIKWGLVD